VFSAEPLKSLYAQLGGALRDGGIFLNADHMPTRPHPASTKPSASTGKRARSGRGPRAWWTGAAGGSWRQRTPYWPGRPPSASGEHADGESHPVEWHADALRAAGFAEARAVWRSVPDALVLGLK
jgi:hypothetical protein